jgi:hypothetical protein
MDTLSSQQLINLKFSNLCKIKDLLSTSNTEELKRCIDTQNQLNNCLNLRGDCGVIFNPTSPLKISGNLDMIDLAKEKNKYLENEANKLFPSNTVTSTPVSIPIVSHHEIQLSTSGESQFQYDDPYFFA